MFKIKQFTEVEEKLLIFLETIWCQYNVNSTSWGALLNWPVFLLIPNQPHTSMSPLSRVMHTWRFVGYKVLIQSYSSLGLKAYVALSSQMIFLLRPQEVLHIMCCFCWSLHVFCRELGIIFFRKDPKFYSTWVQIARNLQLHEVLKFKLLF